MRLTRWISLLLLLLILVPCRGDQQQEASPAGLFNFEVAPWLTLTYPRLFPEGSTQEVARSFSWLAQLPVRARLPIPLVGGGASSADGVSFSLRQLPPGLPPGSSWERHAQLSRKLSSSSEAVVLSEEEALLRQIRDRLTDKVQWLIPPDRTLTVTATRTGVELTLEPAP